MVWPLHGTALTAWPLLGVGVALAMLAVMLLLVMAAGATALLLVALYLRSLPCHPQDSAALLYNAGSVHDTIHLVWERCAAARQRQTLLPSAGSPNAQCPAALRHHALIRRH